MESLSVFALVVNMYAGYHVSDAWITFEVVWIERSLEETQQGPH